MDTLNSDQGWTFRRVVCGKVEKLINDSHLDANNGFISVLAVFFIGCSIQFEVSFDRHEVEDYLSDLVCLACNLQLATCVCRCHVTIDIPQFFGCERLKKSSIHSSDANSSCSTGQALVCAGVKIWRSSHSAS